MILLYLEDMVHDEMKMSTKTMWVLTAVIALFLASTFFALGYIFGTQEKIPIVIEKCSE